MCGILVSISNQETDESLIKIISNIKKRGPDSFNSISINPGTTIFASVLALRGETTIQQPVSSNHGILAFNGEIFNSNLHQNDTLYLSSTLSKSTTIEDVVEILSSLQGPFALVYYIKHLNCLVFAKDLLGRRSLLWNINDIKSSFVITSVGDSNCTWENVDVGINVIYLNNLNDKKSLKNHIKNFEFTNFVNTRLNKSIDIVQEPSNLLDNFYTILNESITKRIISIQSPPKNASRLAILFSGGLDCMVLASLSHFNIPITEPIDLLNVAFENKRVNASNINKDIYNVPDRLTSRQGLQELNIKHPTREFRLIEINIPFIDSKSAQDTIMELSNPNNTVMDLSISLAFWFASKGIGLYNGEIYTSYAKVLFSGLGADEQLGGYTRHRKAFDRLGYTGLLDELQLDLDRIPTRNLGRDDRVISDNGKELRVPYLDENVVSFLSELPIRFKCDFNLGKGYGEKILLRRLAMDARVGPLPKTCCEAKRAIQFGARTARMEVGSSNKGRDLVKVISE